MTQTGSRDAENESETSRLIQQAAAGDERAFAKLLTSQRDRLLAMVALRLDRRLQGRIDPSDVIQEAFIVAVREFPAYAANPGISFYLWLRWITGQRLVEQHRRHLGAQARGADREISLYHGSSPGAATASLAVHLLCKLSSPSQAAMRAEQQLQLQDALNSLEPIDREILTLRHFEGLSNGDAAEVLGIDKSAASKRYARALLKLKAVLLLTLGAYPLAGSP
jgi:RNA polymerase sigma-70 factor, ECF subfamily